MYAHGRGVPKDDVETVKWLRKAAEQGDAESQYILARMYAKGDGVSQDYTEAAKWCCKAAEQGQPVAQFNLGGMYANGQGVPQDLVKAYMWLTLSAAQATPHAKEYRDIITRQMSPPQIEEAQRLARDWKPKGRD